jgi:hypothetical protein
MRARDASSRWPGSPPEHFSETRCETASCSRLEFANGPVSCVTPQQRRHERHRRRRHRDRRNDWRAIEAAAHMPREQRALRTADSWTADDVGNLVGEIDTTEKVGISSELS